MTDLPQAPEYILAAHLIESMRRDTALRPYVYAEPWDQDEQCPAIAIAASQPRGVVAVAPQMPALNTDDPDTTVGTLRARLAVVILTTRQAPSGRSGRLAASLMYKCINAVLRWEWDISGIPYAEPKIDSINTLRMDEMPKLANMAGMVIYASIVYPYKYQIEQ